MDSTAEGDRMTLAPMLKGTSLTNAGYNKSGNTNFVESEKNGAPFYIKDLRDSTYIILRGYIEGLTETISPTWTSENFIGRSEPVYAYEGAERAVAFNLKIVAQTAAELTSIYDKLRKLTSLCYPQYKQDMHMLDKGASDEAGNNVTVGKMRMKPPLLSFRMGELFGNNYKNQLGFMNSLTYTVPDSAPWEFRSGQRVPKYIEASIDLKVLHTTPPHMDTVFYGFPHIG